MKIIIPQRKRNIFIQALNQDRIFIGFITGRSYSSIENKLTRLNSSITTQNMKIRKEGFVTKGY